MNTKMKTEMKAEMKANKKMIYVAPSVKVTRVVLEGTIAAVSIIQLPERAM